MAIHTCLGSCTRPRSQPRSLERSDLAVHTNARSFRRPASAPRVGKYQRNRQEVQIPGADCDWPSLFAPHLEVFEAARRDPAKVDICLESSETRRPRPPKNAASSCYRPLTRPAIAGLRKGGGRRSHSPSLAYRSGGRCSPADNHSEQWRCDAEH